MNLSDVAGCSVTCVLVDQATIPQVYQQPVVLQKVRIQYRSLNVGYNHTPWIVSLQTEVELG